MSNFLGIKQVFLSEYSGLTKSEKLGYLWLVSNPVADGAKGSYDIYFGTRKYSENGITFNNLRNAFEGFLDENGAFIMPVAQEFKSFNDENVENFTDILYALDEAIKANQSALTQIYSISEVDGLISGINNTISSYVKDVKVKITDDETTTLVHAEDGSVTIDLTSFATKDDLSKAGKVKDVKLDGTSIVNAEGVANIVIPSAPEYTIVKGETENGYAATYYLAKDNVKVEVPINIPKDQVLDKATIKTVEESNKPYDGAVVGNKYIEFIFHNNENPQYLPVQDLVDIYTSGVGINVSDNNVISVNIASDENKNFLTVEDNKLAVRSVDTDSTLTTEAITIEGGPLATDAVKAAFEDGIIPEGSNMQAILKALLCVEIYPSPTGNTPDYRIKIETPSISAGDNIKSGALVEVGQIISFNTVKAKGVSVYDKVEPTVKTFTHGYSDTIDGAINSATSIGSTWDIKQMDNNVYELSATKSGFEGTLPTTVSNAVAASCILSSCTLTAVEGENTYSVTEDAPKYTGSYDKVESKYIVSNLGGRSENHKSPSIDAANGIERDADNKTATFKVTGVYPIFCNGVSASTVDAEASSMADLESPVTGDGTKLALMKAGSTFAVSFANQTSEPYRLFLPGNWKITSAVAIDGLKGTYAVDCKSDFVTNGTTTRKIQNKDVTYTVYQWASTEGANRVKFTVA